MQNFNSLSCMSYDHKDFFLKSIFFCKVKSVFAMFTITLFPMDAYIEYFLVKMAPLSCMALVL